MKVYKKILLTVFILFLSSHILNAGILSTWNDSKAYKPTPVIFVHGLWSNAGTWADSIGDTNLSQYFYRYWDYNHILVPSLYLPSKQYLEAFDYSPTSWNHIPTNVFGTGFTLEKAIEQVLVSYYGPNYATNPDAKVILVTHSMGGLLARYYVQEKFRLGQAHYVKRVVLIGVPNLGSVWANNILAVTNITKNVQDALYQSLIMTNPLLGIIISILPNTVLNSTLGITLDDIRKGAVDDMRTNSSFLSSLNSASKPIDIEYTIITGTAESAFRNSDGVVSVDSQKYIDTTQLII